MQIASDLIKLYDDNLEILNRSNQVCWWGCGLSCYAGWSSISSSISYSPKMISSTSETSDSDAVFAVASRIKKVYVGLRIPDADSASRQNIGIVLSSSVAWRCRVT